MNGTNEEFDVETFQRRTMFWCLVCNREVFIRGDNWQPQGTGDECLRRKHRVHEVMSYWPKGRIPVWDERPEE